MAFKDGYHYIGDDIQIRKITCYGLDVSEYFDPQK